MPLIAVFLSHYWKPMALAGLLIAAFAYRAVLVHERDDARGKAAQLTTENAALQSSNQALGAMIDRQNAAVAGLRARADAAENVMAANEDAAARAGAAAVGKAAQQSQALIGAPIDPGSGCVGAIRWGNARAAELSSW